MNSSFTKFHEIYLLSIPAQVQITPKITSVVFFYMFKPTNSNTLYKSLYIYYLNHLLAQRKE